MMKDGSAGMLWRPTIDGDVIPAAGPLASLEAGTNAGVPLFIGWNTDEFKMFGSIPGFGAPSTRAAGATYLVPFLRALHNVTASMDPGSDAKWAAFALELHDLQKAALEARGEPADPRAVNIAAPTSVFFMLPSMETAHAHAKGGGDVQVCSRSFSHYPRVLDVPNLLLADARCASTTFSGTCTSSTTRAKLGARPTPSSSVSFSTAFVTHSARHTCATFAETPRSAPQ